MRILNYVSKEDLVLPGDTNATRILKLRVTKDLKKGDIVGFTQGLRLMINGSQYWDKRKELVPNENLEEIDN